MLKQLITALACVLPFAAMAQSKTPDVAIKLSADFKPGGSSKIFVYSTAENFLNLAAVCVGVNCEPKDTMGVNTVPKNAKPDGYSYVSASHQSYTLDKGAQIALIYTVGVKPSIHKRVYELNLAGTGENPAGYELTLKDESYVAEMVVQVTPPPAQNYVPALPLQYQYPQQQPQYQNYGNSLQGIAQARANAMASNNYMPPNHAIAGAPPKPSNVFEGIGAGGSPYPNTCVGSGAVIADAVARSANGMTYRVRFYSN